jgi:hypothetical protein
MTSQNGQKGISANGFNNHDNHSVRPTGVVSAFSAAGPSRAPYVPTGSTSVDVSTSFNAEAGGSGAYPGGTEDHKPDIEENEGWKADERWQESEEVVGKKRKWKSMGYGEEEMASMLLTTTG